MQGTMMAEPVNTRLLQENRRKEMRIAQLEKENKALKELVTSYRKNAAARYERHEKKQRRNGENVEYLVLCAGIVAALFGAVYIGWGIYSLIWWFLR